MPVFSNGFSTATFIFRTGTRLRELEELIARDDIAALVCVRGGYGSNYLRKSHFEDLSAS